MQLLAVVCDATARTAQSEARTNEHRKAELLREVETVSQIVDQRGL